MKPMTGSMIAIMIGLITSSSHATSTSATTTVEAYSVFSTDLTTPTLTAQPYNITGVINGKVAFQVTAKNNNNMTTNIGFSFAEPRDGKTSQGTMKNGSNTIDIELVPENGTYDGNGITYDAMNVAPGDSVSMEGVVSGTQIAKPTGRYTTTVQAMSWVN